LILDPGKTVIVLFVAFLLGILPSVNWSRRSTGVKILGIAGALFLLASLGLILVVIGVISVLGRFGSSGQGYGGFQSTTPGLRGPISTFLLIAIFAVQVFYTYVLSRTLSDELGPEAGDRRPRGRAQGTPVDARIARVEGAQHGNLVLYGGENPFIGTGVRIRAWSIAIELQRDNSGTQSLPDLSRAQGYVPIDPVEVQRVIRERLRKLDDEGLPPSERLTALTVADHIVGPGRHRFDSRLVDPALGVPYSLASAEAVAAVIRHPQAGVRYYQRASVYDEGQAVWSGQRKVVDGFDQDIATSAFVHVAVEGRMLYLEFVATVMPPIDPALRVVDLLPRLSAPRFWIKVLTDTITSVFRVVISSPFRVVGSLVTMAAEGRTYQQQVSAAHDQLHADVGAQLSIREISAAKSFETYIQKLDAEKYTKLIERLVNDTVLDFLASKGVDTSAYASSAAAITYNSVSMGSGNTFNAPAAAGIGSRIQQGVQAQQTSK
jgi:hypothetical protein